MEAILRRIRYLHEEERLQEHPAPDPPIDQLKETGPSREVRPPQLAASFNCHLPNLDYRTWGPHYENTFSSRRLPSCLVPEPHMRKAAPHSAVHGTTFVGQPVQPIHRQRPVMRRARDDCLTAAVVGATSSTSPDLDAKLKLDRQCRTINEDVYAP
jgi:hypothetical protein